MGRRREGIGLWWALVQRLVHPGQGLRAWRQPGETGWHVLDHGLTVTHNSHLALATPEPRSAPPCQTPGVTQRPQRSPWSWSLTGLGGSFWLRALWMLPTSVCELEWDRPSKYGLGGGRDREEVTVQYPPR